jgi:hypothetical protein
MEMEIDLQLKIYKPTAGGERMIFATELGIMCGHFAIPSKYPA